MSERDALAAHALLVGLDSNVIDTLDALARRRSFTAGSYVMREGDEADTLHLVLGGRISLEVHVPGKETVRVQSAAAGDVVGLSWLFPPERVHLDARVVEPATTLAFDAAQLRRAMDGNPALGYALTRRLLRVAYDRLSRTRMQQLDVYGR